MRVVASARALNPCFYYQFSKLSSFSSSSVVPNHHEEDKKSVKIAVWWDFENCCIPNGVNPFRVSNRIISALRFHGICGPVSITGFGDVTRLSKSVQDGLSASGICLTHVPNSGKNSSDRSLLADLVYWVSHNPPPVHFFLISGDGDFANILHRLRMNNYNILLAGGDGTSGVLCSAATIMWLWNSLARGENFNGRHFNHPPDGIYGSWYGHFKGVLENPFPEIDQTVNPVSEEIQEPCIDSKSRQIPKALVNAIRQVLSSHPEGITMSELRSELKKSNVVLEKDYFGHKKFSHLLLSMPSVLKFKFNSGDTQPQVHGVHQRPALLSEGDGKYSQKTVESSLFSTSEDKAESIENFNLHERVEDGASKTSYESESCKNYGNENLGERLTGHKIETSEEVKSETGIIGVVSKKVDQEIESVSSVSAKGVSNCAVNSETNTIQKNSETNKETVSKNVSMANNDESTPKRSFVGRILEWFRSRKEDYGSSGECHEEISQLNDHSVKKQETEKSLDLSSMQPEPLNLFTKSHFWDSMESFLGTPTGSNLVSQSKNRDELMHGLQKEGPLVLTALKEDNLRQLVNLLILEKKWVEESDSQIHHFKLTLPVKRQLPPSEFYRSKDLRSIFSDRSTRSTIPKTISELKFWFSRAHEANDTALSSLDYERWFEAEFGKKLEPLTYGYFTVDDMIASSDPGDCVSKSRSDTLTDCKKLLTDFLKHHPQGFNIGLFRPMFFKRYGYVLDYQSLGYPKLASLLQIDPAVRIESSLVLPAELKSNEVIAEKEEELGGEKEQSWDELGPLSENKGQVKNKGVSALLKVLDGYYSGPKEDSGRKISFVSDFKEEDERDRKRGESRSKSKFDAMGI